MAENETAANSHGWIGTETVETKFGNFEFKNGYPTPAAAEALLAQLKLNRAIEDYLTQMMPVSEIGLREGLRTFGAKKPTQVVIWDDLMDAKTVLLTANTETVYAAGHLDLKTDGPTVVEAPPAHAGFSPRRSATLPVRHWAVGSRQGRRREVSRLATRLRGKCA
jgi:hypothetical protein